jgi:GNAT superfamily N-acetyltransferase
VPPLTAVDARQVDPRRHPFFAHAETGFFLGVRGGRTVGRISTCRDRLHDEFHGDRVGFFGHFDAVDSAAARALLAHAERWLADHGALVMRGPVDLSTNYRCGLLVEDAEPGPPVVMMPYARAEYAGFLEAAGLAQAKDLVALILRTATLDMARVHRVADRVRRRLGVVMRPVDLRRFDSEIKLLWQLYHRIWERNWGFVPMSHEEFVAEAKGLRSVLRPELTLIAEIAGEPVAMLLGVPDINIAIRACNGRLLPFGFLRFVRALRRVTLFRVLTLGVLPDYRGSGLDALLLTDAVASGLAHGFDSCEASWILEDNHAMLRPLESMGARAYRRYRIYEKPLQQAQR